MVHSRTEIPQPGLEEFDLEWAVGIWKEPTEVEVIRKALSIVRYWHADRVDLLRRVDRASKPADWLDLKKEEEILEVYITDLKDALWTTAHINKMVGTG